MTPERPETQLVWFKKDLRVHDHLPLSEAARRGPVLPLYVYEPEQLHHEEFGGQHLGYLNGCLSALDADLRGLGTPLVLRAGEVTAVLEGLWQETRFGAVWAHQETGNAVSFQRDLRVRAWARARGVQLNELPQNGVIRGLRSRGSGGRDGWADAWEERMSAPQAATPTGLLGTPLDPQGLRSHRDLGVPEDARPLPPSGHAAARELLGSFLTERGVDYTREMSSPLSAEASCSRLSAPLAFGTLSLRSVVQATRQRLAGVRGDLSADARWTRSLRSFESRLHWHCHFMQRLESEPQMEFRNLNRALDGLREADWNEEHFARWAAGQTGYPLVDACMRSLTATGWLNFRMRAMLVSFASQHLWLHWRRTGLVLARRWLDNEPGIHWSQMQMQSSVVGINRTRIYSPTRQARTQDPQGVFIRRWVPELAGVPTDFIHAPWEWSGAGRLTYPAPVVHEGRAGAAARARLQAAQEGPEFAPEAKRIYLLHGSRKKAAQRAERAAAGLPPRQRPAKAAAPRKAAASSGGQPPLFGELPGAPGSGGPPIPLPGVPDDWQQALTGARAAGSFHGLRDFLKAERSVHTVYPPAAEVFNALRFTPLENVRVLILGQDPYHGAGQAHGLSFSVRPGVRVPPSLQNIYQELQSDLSLAPPRHGDLRSWAGQGVLLLNAVLTVRAGEANSHAGKGWEAFTDAVIRAVNAKPGRVVFVLWGAYARKKAKLITGKQHTIIESAHPSPLSAAHFLGSRPFSRVNAALEETGEPPIDWRPVALDGP